MQQTHRTILPLNRTYCSPHPENHSPTSMFQNADPRAAEVASPFGPCLSFYTQTPILAPLAHHTIRFRPEYYPYVPYHTRADHTT
ncbi:Uncharacterized protein HZ326_5445 [Fusarium oxysporum f. sp. albedinis]|nr:Uncharacterized protein HZ326_5445 [Fusarium oxysporum f. sp. albedinis]